MSINAKEYFDLLKEQVNLGKEVSMVITGNSMSPFLEHGKDTIYFKKPDRKPRRGDMVFFQRENGKYVMHRLYKRKKSECFFIGDNQTEIEGPLSEDHIFAVVTKVKRKGKLCDKRNFWWFFFAHIWLFLIPIRPFLISFYQSIFKRKQQSEQAHFNSPPPHS